MYYTNKCIQKPTVKIHFMTQFAEFNRNVKGSLTKTLQSLLSAEKMIFFHFIVFKTFVHLNIQ